MKRSKIVQVYTLLLALVLVAVPGAAQAASSKHYLVHEYQFGNGSQSAEKTCKDARANNRKYCARESLGATTVGHASSQNYQFYGGFNTTKKPLLETFVSGGTYDLGVLNSAETHSVATTFSVRNYLSNDYVVKIGGKAPESRGGYRLKPIDCTTPNASPMASQTGTEQFGINLADNSVPDIGATPKQIPDSTFGYGYATADYSTSNYYCFHSGDVVARSDKSSGTTKYTIAIIANIANTTPAGYYTGNLDVVVVPTF
jgi:hypothetical protein